jgi:hypothetical protein
MQSVALAEICASAPGTAVTYSVCKQHAYTVVPLNSVSTDDGSRYCQPGCIKPHHLTKLCHGELQVLSVPL